MPEVIEFLGIGFRSTEHLSWFLGSCTMMLATATSFTWMIMKRPEADTRRLLVVFWCLLSLFHLGASIAASLHAYDQVYVRNESPNGHLFSVDCIWFNALVFALYLAMLVFVRRWNQKHPAKES